MISNKQLINRAKEVLHCRNLTDECIAGEVSSAIVTTSGNVYVGVSISAGCGIGFCAEHGAAQMVTNGETQIQKVVALSGDGSIPASLRTLPRIVLSSGSKKSQDGDPLGPRKDGNPGTIIARTMAGFMG